MNDLQTEKKLNLQQILFDQPASQTHRLSSCKLLGETLAYS